MADDDPSGRHPPLQPSGRPPREVEDFDERLWTYGAFIAAIIAAVALVGAVIWALHGDRQAASRPQTKVSGDQPTIAESKKLAASVLPQDEKNGQRKKEWLGAGGLWCLPPPQAGHHTG